MEIDGVQFVQIYLPFIILILIIWGLKTIKNIFK